MGSWAWSHGNWNWRMDGLMPQAVIKGPHQLCGRHGASWAGRQIRKDQKNMSKSTVERC